MLTMRRQGFALALVLAVGSSAQAADETAVVTSATKLLEEIAANPKSGIPARFLREAKGILIVPHMVESEFGLGRKKGRGVFLTRNEKGEWGNPEPFEITGGSVGAQAGRAVMDMVMIYRTPKAADAESTKQHLILSADFHILASLRQSHEFSGPGPESKTKKDVLTYRRRRGLLVGAKISGEHWWNPTFPYEDEKPPPTAAQATADAKATGKVAKRDAPAPTPKAQQAAASPEAARLKTVLTRMTSPPPTQVAARRTRDPQVSPASGVMPATQKSATPR